MPDWVRTLFDSQDFMPHGHCFLWYPEILWLHVVSDILIGIAYFSIPVAILAFARRRRDLPFRSLYILFGLFIVLCGTTHFISVWVQWNPDYGIEGIVKGLTAIASVITGIMVYRLMPAAITMPSPAELHAMNQQLKEVNVRTEEEVAKRTAELQATNEQLQESEKKLQIALRNANMASHAKSDFLANMSHEIRTPMNAIIGLTSYLMWTEGLTARQRECLQTIDMSASALMDLIDDLLDITKIEARQIELDYRPFNLRTIIDECVAIMAVRAQEKGLYLKQHTASDMITDFVGDPVRIRQVITNLLGNAAKFTDRGGIDFHVSTQKVLNDQAEVTLKISDTGIGIKPENIPHIFEKFTQGDSSIKRKYGGSGLGLAIAWNFVTQMKGRIDVDSQPGRGSCFTVKLTLQTNTSPFEEDSTMSVPAPQIQASSHHSKGHILIIEDWQPNILVISLMLEKLGYSYDVAQNGIDGFRLFQSKKYDAILMDIRLPDIDGYEITRRIRGFEATSGAQPTPIIATTAYAMNQDREKCLAGGMNAYLSKPLDNDDLDTILKKFVPSVLA
ncbi:MAG: ATP-binding protein [Alphaproteobacteria bacterium]